MAHDVFISHSSKDKSIADAVCSILEQRKIRCWIAPRDILPGQDYAEGIINGISECCILVLIFSQNSNNSKHVLREIERAANYEKMLIPFRIQNVKPIKAMEYWLSTPHWMDAITPTLERHIETLAIRCQTIISPMNDLDSNNLIGKHHNEENIVLSNDNKPVNNNYINDDHEDKDKADNDKIHASIKLQGMSSSNYQVKNITNMNIESRGDFGIIDPIESVVTIGSNESKVYGTGVYIGDGLVITCGHTIKMIHNKAENFEGLRVKVGLNGNQTSTSVVRKFEYDKANMSRDFCILSLPADFAYFRELIVGNFSQVINSNTKVTLLGFPLGRALHGKIVEEIDDGLYQIELMEENVFEQNFSGSPVYEPSSGMFLGILARTNDFNIKTTFMIHAQRLKEFFPRLVLKAQEIREKSDQKNMRIGIENNGIWISNSNIKGNICNNTTKY